MKAIELNDCMAFSPYIISNVQLYTHYAIYVDSAVCFGVKIWVNIQNKTALIEPKSSAILRYFYNHSHLRVLF